MRREEEKFNRVLVNRGRGGGKGKKRSENVNKKS